MDLERFGQYLRGLRKRSGLTQAGLAQQVPVSPDLISIWERAYAHQGRRWLPDRSSVLRLVEIFADQLTPEEAQEWLALLGYRLGQAELQRFFPPKSPRRPTWSSPSATSPTSLKRLALPPEQRLFGVGQAHQRLAEMLEQTEAPWLIAIDGIGGIGKSSLAAALVREMTSLNRFYAVAWVSAKREEFSPRTGIRAVDRPTLSLDDLANALLEQLDKNLPFAPASLAAKLAHLTTLLKKYPYLIVIDNLETVVDDEALLPLLCQLAQPSKFLLTSRHSLRACPDTFCLTLAELDQASTLALVKYEAEMRGLTLLAGATPAQLEAIYQVVGGNPLALKLVIGQIHLLPLSQVLENLRQAQGKKAEDLYTYIYWQAWQGLDPLSQKVLLVMPLAQGGTLAQLGRVSEVAAAELDQALEHLITLSLVEAYGDLEERRYRIHRLTETFLLIEVTEWQQRL